MQTQIKNLIYSVSVNIEIDIEAVRYLSSLAHRHYDKECQDTAHRFGIFHTWMNKFPVENPGPIIVPISFAEADLIAKVCEQEFRIPLEENKGLHNSFAQVCLILQNETSEVEKNRGAIKKKKK